MLSVNFFFELESLDDLSDLWVIVILPEIQVVFLHFCFIILDD